MVTLTIYTGKISNVNLLNPLKIIVETIEPVKMKYRIKYTTDNEIQHQNTMMTIIKNRNYIHNYCKNNENKSRIPKGGNA